MTNFTIATAGTINLEALATALKPLLSPAPTPTPTPTPAPTPTPSGTTPTNVVAVAQPYSALVSFTEIVASTGKTIVDYTAVSTSQGWLQGQSPHSPILAQGGSAGWGGSSNQFQVRANYSDGTKSPWSTPSNGVIPTGGSGASKSPNILVGGVFYWQGDYSYGTDGVQYGDPAGGLGFHSTSFGGWQPYAPTNNFDLTPYKYLLLDLMGPTGQSWSIYFEQIGDANPPGENPVFIDASGKYGPAPKAGQWGSYKIPLADLNLGAGTPNPNIYKLQVHGTLGGSNKWNIDNVRFA